MTSFILVVLVFLGAIVLGWYQLWPIHLANKRWDALVKEATAAGDREEVGRLLKAWGKDVERIHLSRRLL